MGLCDKVKRFFCGEEKISELFNSGCVSVGIDSSEDWYWDVGVPKPEIWRLKWYYIFDYGLDGISNCMSRVQREEFFTSEECAKEAKATLEFAHDLMGQQYNLNAIIERVDNGKT